MFDVAAIHRRAFRPLVLCTVGMLAACGRGENVTMPTTEQSAQARKQSAASDMAQSRVAAAPVMQAPAPPPAPQPPQSPQGGSTVTMIIRTGHAVIEVDSLEVAIAAVHRMATALGGVVGNTSLASGEYQVRSATIELRIPSQRFNEALEGLKPLGKVESVESNAQDVSEEFVDVSARVANAKRLEERLISLLANRAGKLEEVLAVERELARVREEIERYEGRIRYLSTRVATSTLTITVHEPRPLVGNAPGSNILGDAFKRAWRNFVEFIAEFIAALGVLIPLGVLFAPLIVWIVRREKRAASLRNSRSTTDPV